MIALWWWAVSVASGASLQEGLDCLAANDVPCADAVVEALDADQSSRADLLVFAAETAFFGARFGEAVTLIERAIAAGYADKYDRLGLYTRTRDITADYEVTRRGRFEVVHAPGVDTILAEDALKTLELAERHISPLLGGPPPGITRVEIYPDGRSFKGVVSLPEDAVERTGVVAISKWSRLLILSPRALGRGYGWQDTIAHEYVHLVLSHHSKEKAPLWLQEGVAKYLDERWPDGRDHFRLGAQAEGYLAKAIATNTLVTREEMGSSFATMDSAERASLAYAMVSSQVGFAFERGGTGVLAKVVPTVRGGGSAEEALATAAGFADYVAFEAAWLAWIKGQGLIQRKLSALPTVVDGGSDIDLDPVLSRRSDLARWVRLGDLLQERGHFEAALVEYAKAVPEDEPSSPLLDNRVAQAHLALKAPDRAQQVLERSLKDYPEFTLTHKTLGEIHRAKGNNLQALAAYEAAAAYNPFDREVQLALAELNTALGRSAEAARRQDMHRILTRGGKG